jgi:hypothetical protein
MTPWRAKAGSEPSPRHVGPMGRTAGCLSGSYRGRRSPIVGNSCPWRTSSSSHQGGTGTPGISARRKCAPVTGQKATQWARSAGQSVVRRGRDIYPGRIGGVRSASAGGQEPPPSRGTACRLETGPFLTSGWRRRRRWPRWPWWWRLRLGAMRFSPVASTLPRRSRAATGTRHIAVPAPLHRGGTGSVERGQRARPTP